MLDNFSILQKTPLFAGIDAVALQDLLARLSPQEQAFAKGDIILRAGQNSEHLGILLAGNLDAFRFSPDGTTTAVPPMAAGSVFGDVLGGASVSSPVTIKAASDCHILWISYDALLHPQGVLAPAHGILLQNLLRNIGNKYFDLLHRIDLLSLHSLRAKISAYLLAEAANAGSNTFSIPFTRAKLADYLHCERSALCRELSRMQQEGLLETYQKSFKLLRPEALTHLP